MLGFPEARPLIISGGTCARSMRCTAQKNVLMISELIPLKPITSGSIKFYMFTTLQFWKCTQTIECIAQKIDVYVHSNKSFVADPRLALLQPR